MSKQQPGVVQLQWWSRSSFGVAGGEKQGPGLEVEAGNETDPCFGVKVNKPQTGFWRGGVSRFWGALLLKGQAERRHMQVLYLRAAGPVAGLFCTATIAPVPTSHCRSVKSIRAAFNVYRNSAMIETLTSLKFSAKSKMEWKRESHN